jgi:hypothetical protein
MHTVSILYFIFYNNNYYFRFNEKNNNNNNDFFWKTDFIPQGIAIPLSFFLSYYYYILRKGNSQFKEQLFS